ncbi:MAG TPA: hypothetical protein VFB06_08260 [Streptosporangiaceae bacterium]|nr:hypothetical protein [Streptosporangiaceae bacterium]
MYVRGSAVAAGTASALFAAVSVGTIGRIVGSVAVLVGCALTVRCVVLFRGRA